VLDTFVFVLSVVRLKGVSVGKREYFFAPEYLKMIIRVYILMPVVPHIQFYNFMSPIVSQVCMGLRVI